MKKLAVLLAFLALPAGAEPQDAAMPAALGVHLQKPAGDGVHFSHGSGVYLGDGFVLTAAHVVTINPAEPKTTVMMDGWLHDAKLVATAQGGVDLALLRIEPGEMSSQRRALKPVEVCDAGTQANQPVVVAALDTVTLSKTVSAPIHSSTLNGDWSDILASRFVQGASGGGLFDAYKGCLAGILIIGVTNPGVELTEFAPAPQIRAFLATQLPAARH